MTSAFKTSIFVLKNIIECAVKNYFNKTQIVHNEKVSKA
jgi:hypothetical protein